MQLGQEWRTENSNRYFPFEEGSEIPKGFISDIKFLHNKRGPEDVYLHSVSLEDDLYSLEFRFADDTVAISTGNNPIPRLHGLKQVHVFGPNNESVVVFSTGEAWKSPPDGINSSNGKIDSSLVSSGPNLIRRIIIHGEDNDEGEWRKEETQTIKGGTNIDLSLAGSEDLTTTQDTQEFIEISAVYGAGYGAPEYIQEDGIITINGLLPRKGNFGLSGFDCIKKVDQPDGSENTTKIMSDCLPCCGCSSYQLISDAITYRSQKLADLCAEINSILISSVDTYNAAVVAMADSIRPVARIRAVRVYQDRIKMALQNVCALPIYGRYGITLSASVGFTNISPPSVSIEGLPAANKYNSYINTESGDVPTGTFRGIVGPINPGSFIDLVFTAPWSGTTPEEGVELPDLRGYTIDIAAQANGYFGALPTLGCQKDVYSASVSPDESIETSCNNSVAGVRYKVVVSEAP